MIHSPKPQVPAVCDACGFSLPFEQIPKPLYAHLLEAQYHRRFAAEVLILQKVAAFYQRNPALEDQIKPQVLSTLHSKDPRVQAQLSAGIPFNEIQLPPEPEPRIGQSHLEDADVIAYLRRCSFSLKPRMEFVVEQLEKTRTALVQTRCMRCDGGQMWLATHHI